MMCHKCEGTPAEQSIDLFYGQDILILKTQLQDGYITCEAAGHRTLIDYSKLTLEGSTSRMCSTCQNVNDMTVS